MIRPRSLPGVSALAALWLAAAFGAFVAPGFSAVAAPAKKEDAEDGKKKGQDAKAQNTKAQNTKTKDTKANDAKSKDAKSKDAKGKDAKGKDAKGKDAKPGAPKQVANFGDWGAFVAQGKSRTCYALAKPSARAPATLKRDDAYIFISNRPAENVRNEVSVIMGFPMKDNSEPKAEIGGTTFDLVAKGSNAWVKNPAEEGQFIEAMRRGSRLTVKATSVKGNTSTDTYSLSGLSDALARVQKECQ